MAGYNKLLKRKGLDHVTVDDLSDFPLSSPATKIRRLDAELPPIAEGELEHDQTMPTPPIAEGLEAPAVNEERALVLFKPLLHSSSPFSLALDPHLISQIKNGAPWSKQGDSDCDRLVRSAVEGEEEEKRNRGMALVPWVPSASSSSSSSSQFPVLQDSNNSESMEADDELVEASMMMDVEQEDAASTMQPTASTIYMSHDGRIAGTTAPEGFHQQQHCFLPQIPQATSTPITWTR